MKTKNNVQKAVMKSLAVIMSLVLLSITVQAQDFWATVLNNNSFNQIAMALTSEPETPLASTETASNTEAYASYFAEEAELPMNVELWMVNESNLFAAAYSVTEADKSLTLEDWMLNDKLFNGSTQGYETEHEAVLELDEWMTDPTVFDVSTIAMETEPDAQLQLEAWMTNANIWNF